MNVNTLKTSFSLVFIVLLSASCGTSNDQSDAIDGPADEVVLTENELGLIGTSNDFAFGLFREVNAGNPQANTFISPLSASMMFGMALNGAVGQTATDIKTTLGLTSYTDEQINEGYRLLREYFPAVDPEVQVEMADSLWWSGSNDPKDEFLNACSEYFDAETGTLNADAINDWVYEATNGTIEEIDVPMDVFFMMIDALYFKGSWTFEFEEVIEEVFHTDSGYDISVPMMTEDLEVPMFDLAHSHGVELSYGEGKYAMTIIVPTYGTGVDDFAATFDRATWEEIGGAMALTERTVTLPRFELDFHDCLNGYLASMGMENVFYPAGDFSEIYEGLQGFDTVEQYSYVKVDEHGTEASAVTSGSFGVSMGDDGFVADRPFLFVIHEKTSGAILFMGKLDDPTK